MIKNFKYFVYGIPKNPTDPLYALYQPVLDRFLIVVDQLDIAKKLSALLLTRYTTHFCCVSVASNYEPNIIDNEVCDSWTLSNCTDADIDSTMYINDPIPVAKLIPTTNTVLWDLAKEKEWALFCFYWIKFFGELKLYYYHYYQLDSILTTILPKDQIDYYPHQLEQQVMNELFFGQNVDDVNSKILKLIHAEPTISTFWKEINIL